MLNASLIPQDDVYNGFFIPKDTFILANVWAMNHDPEIFPEPNTFRPERWLEPSPRALQYDTSLSEKPAVGPGVNNVWFGFGRRYVRTRFRLMLSLDIS